jgi:PleD family two-component response regulator
MTGALEKTEARIDEPKVLLVDDNTANLQVLRENLEGLGYKLLIAKNGKSALEIVRKARPDLILLDIMMPKISGFEVCKRLRANPGTSDIAILMITALDQPSDQDRAVEAGTDDFLTKPINRNELLLRVRSLLKSRHYKRELDRALAYIEAVERGGS